MLWVWGGVVGPWHDIPSGAEHAASESEAKALQAKCKELQASIGSGQEARISFHRTLRIDLHFSTSAGFLEAAQIGDSEAGGECLCRKVAADDWCM